MPKSCEIQDNERENELIDLFKLKKASKTRTGIDAKLRVQFQDHEIELKSTTVGDVSTARNLHLDHIAKWRHQHWIIGVYNKDVTLSHCYYGSPEDMTEWLDYWEADIKRGLSISDMLIDRIDMDMVVSLFGDSDVYSYEDAKYVYKGLYTKDEYNSLKDCEDGYYPDTMLKMFKEHNKSYLYRGSSRNNPKITKTYYEKWKRIDVNHSREIRKILKEYTKNKTC